MSKCCFHKLANNQITIEQQTQSVDDYGTPIKTWSTYKKVWAYIEPKAAKEINEFGQLISKVYYKVVIRFDATIDNSFRLKIDGNACNIAGIKTLATDMKTFGRDYLELTAVEGEIS